MDSGQHKKKKVFGIVSKIDINTGYLTSVVREEP